MLNNLIDFDNLCIDYTWCNSHRFGSPEAEAIISASVSPAPYTRLFAPSTFNKVIF